MRSRGVQAPAGYTYVTSLQEDIDGKKWITQDLVKVNNHWVWHRTPKTTYYKEDRYVQR